MNFVPEIWMDGLLEPARRRIEWELWHHPVPSGQLHEPSPADLRRLRRLERRNRSFGVRFRAFWWHLRDTWAFWRGEWEP